MTGRPDEACPPVRENAHPLHPTPATRRRAGRPWPLATRAGLMAALLALASPHAPANPVFLSSTNHWTLPVHETLERIAFVFAPSITVEGETLDDTFWLATEEINLAGHFGNDVWAIGTAVRFTGHVADHLRAAARTITLDGLVSNGLWAAGFSVAVTTNATLIGDQFIIGDRLSLLGYIDGDLYARGRQVTLGGSIAGNVYLYGNDIVVRPGTRILGDLYYITTNQAIVLDANSLVGGSLRRIDPPDAFQTSWSPATSALIQLFWFGSALLVGLVFILLFPGYTGQTVQALRGGLWKSGLAGLAVLFIMPLLILAALLTLIGMPLAMVMAASYGLLLYLGKIPVALAVGTALLQRRGQVSLSTALLALVTGLFMYYSIGLIPQLGASLQTAATAFGTGSMVLALAARRGRVQIETQIVTPSET